MEQSIVPLKLYRQFVKRMPLACVDIVVKNSGKFLFVKRKFNPARNQWWFPGGRVFFNEGLRQSAKRKLAEELAVKKIKSIEFLGTDVTKFKKGYFNLPTHTVNSVFLAEIDNNETKKIKLDLINHFGYKWIDQIPKNIHSYLKKFLKLAGFK